jgi:hypothetical protein
MFPKRRRMPPLAVFITLALLAAPLAVEAQQAGKVYRIGILAQFGPNVPESARLWDGLLQGLRELGYVAPRAPFTGVPSGSVLTEWTSSRFNGENHLHNDLQ